ncbi:MAG: hypothetical protein E6I69_07740 [Chloroflexi bacterium]|nr:MAG: hypothetical protein E6I69_07740 [Chloroflexota bacterium]
MNITRQPVTMTHAVSAATPAAWVAVLSSAITAAGSRAAAAVTPPASASTSRRFFNASRN